MSKVDIPNPGAPPRSPLDDPELKRQRQIASDTVMADAAMTGRRSTIVGGAVMAQEKQFKSAAARRSLGLET